MPCTIQLAAFLPAPPDRLFDMYLDPVEHAAFTGSPVTIAAQAVRNISAPLMTLSPARFSGYF